MRVPSAVDERVASCALHAAVGQADACPQAGCAFWEDDPVAGGGCAVERFVARVEWSPELAHFLLALRRQLEDARWAVSSHGRSDDVRS